MSELEVGRRAQNVQPISTSAITKIRAIGSAGQLATQADGLDDVFAQVFAHMTQANAVESAAATDDGSDESLLDAENLVQSSEEPQDKAEDPSAADQYAELVPVLTDESLGNPSDNQEDAAQANEILEKVDLEQADGNEEIPEDLVPQEQAQQVTVEVDRETLVKPLVADTEQGEAEVVDAVAVATVSEASLDKEGADRRRYSKGIKEIPQGPIVAEDSKRADPAEESQPEVTKLGLDSDQSEFGQQSSSDDGADRPRRLRGRRGGAHAVNGNEAAKQIKPAEEALLRALSSQNAAAGQSNAAVESIDPNSMDAGANSTRQGTPSLGSVAQAAMSSARVSASLTNSSTGGANQFGTVAAVDGKEAPAAAKDQTNGKSTKANTAETVSRVKLIQRVSKAFQHLGPDGGTVRLRLAPAELGSVRVEMRIQQRKIQARVVAETEAASTALREHLPELRQRLESQGLQIERLEVEIDSGDREASDFQNHQDNERQQSRWQSPTTPRKPAPRTEPSMAKGPAEVSHSSVSPMSTDGVDLHL
ncbi:MAG: flagellar hook-length control protein FliK [Rubripirellula sp.]|nr:flagellar hook-length control protein FliK [Rubripirellula sp.]